MTNASGGPTKETLEEQEIRLRALLVAKKKRKVTASSVSTDEARRAERAERFRSEREERQKEEAEKDRTQGGYFGDFEAARETVELDDGGSWRKHYNDNTDEALVSTQGVSLGKYITNVIQGADSGCISFKAGDRTGQLSTFRLELWTYWVDGRYKNMTIAGAVYATEVLVFHAGPGS
jgi:hypothetical protein